jgi:signal transduction histidine kinase
MSVTDAVDGLAGLELARTLLVDLVLVDINIPRLNGYEVVTRLRAEERLVGVPVIAITAEGDRARSLALGFDGFIVKPIKMASFVDDLEAFVGGKRETIPEEERASHLEEHGRETVRHLENRVKELKRANERLRELDGLKMEVLRNVSHELSTPMTPLLGYLNMLENQELGTLTEGQNSAVEGMGRCLNRLKEVIDNLLNVTRIATGSVALECTVVRPEEIVSQVMEAVEPQARARKMTLETRLEAGLEPAMVDRARLCEALRQLVENALKFSPEGGVVVFAVRLEVVEEGDKRLISFEISDRGEGIPESDRNRVIQPFFQLDGSATRAVGGTGLGLTIADRTARLHGGELRIDGREGGGTCVTFRVPTRPEGAGTA